MRFTLKIENGGIKSVSECISFPVVEPRVNTTTDGADVTTTTISTATMDMSLTTLTSPTDGPLSTATGQATREATTATTTTTKSDVTQVNVLTAQSVDVVQNILHPQNDSTVDTSSTTSLPVCVTPDIQDCDGTGCDSEYVAKLCPKMCGLCH